MASGTEPHAAGGERVLVCASRFNEAVTRRLVDGALATLREHGFGEDRVDVVWVPGAFELPVTLQRCLATSRYCVAVAVGAIVRGETPHFDYIARETTRGLGDVALRHGVPIGFGVLTCDTLDQALARAGGAAGNKGGEAAAAAVEALRAIRRVERDAPA
ncbi:MAG: 6,7-dimethyl-8-ribityllumazine synthase [Gemmatimonadetes bacterium]|nr:6,7-dimethyl-8-ribityllumazine synthase [Gemmatimonadota bacterium]